MLLRERIANQLRTVRGLLEQMLQDFKSPKDWTFQVAPTANHALWAIGHLGLVDRFFLKALALGGEEVPPSYHEKFGMGSRPQGSPDSYPPADEVLAFFRSGREAVLKGLEKFDDAALTAAPPAGMPPFVTDVGSAFEAIVFHEGLHAGQVSVARRGLGFDPVFGGK